MLTNQKVPRTKSLGNTSINSADTQLFEQLTDTTAEKISGAAISNPTTTAGISEKPPSAEGNTAELPSMANPSSLNLTPFYPSLPTPKLARLKHLRGKSPNPK